MSAWPLQWGWGMGEQGLGEQVTLRLAAGEGLGSWEVPSRRPGFSEMCVPVQGCVRV